MRCRLRSKQNLKYGHVCWRIWHSRTQMNYSHTSQKSFLLFSFRVKLIMLRFVPRTFPFNCGNVTVNTRTRNEFNYLLWHLRGVRLCVAMFNVH